MQTTAIGTVANSLPENEVILLTILISDGYIPYTELQNNLNRSLKKEFDLCYRFDNLCHLFDFCFIFVNKKSLLYEFV